MEEPKDSGEKPKKEWQYKGDNWYDNLDVTEEQVNKVIRIGFAALIAVFVLIGLEAAGIFKL